MGLGIVIVILDTATRYFYIVFVVIVVFVVFNILDYTAILCTTENYLDRDLSDVYLILQQTTVKERLTTENYLKGTSLHGYTKYFNYIVLPNQVFFS